MEKNDIYRSPGYGKIIIIGVTEEKVKFKNDYGMIKEVCKEEWDRLKQAGHIISEEDYEHRMRIKHGIQDFEL